jgi:hypothetical protein
MMDMNLEQLAGYVGIPCSELDHMRDMAYVECGFDFNDSTKALHIEDYLYEELLDIKNDLEAIGEM